MIRTTKIEIWKFSPERREAWREMAVQIQQATNLLWQYWLVYHTLHNTVATIKEDIERYHQWQQADKKTRGKKPLWLAKPFPNSDWAFSKIKGARLKPVKKGQARDPDAKPIQNPPDLRNDLYHLVVTRFPQLSTHTVTLLINKWLGNLKTRKSASGNLPGWCSILFNLEQVPSFTRPLPIPFDIESCRKQIPLKQADGTYHLCVSVERGDGKTLADECELVLNRRKTASVRAIVDRLIDGSYEFKGSQLVYQRGKWYVAISYEMPESEAVAIDPNKTLRLFGGKRMPWLVILPKAVQQGKRFSRLQPRFGRGPHVTSRRQRIQNNRWSRQQHNRWAGSATKGRGRSRAIEGWTRLQSCWKNFVNSYNHRVTKQVIRQCLRDGIGKIVYYQPMDEKRDQMFLAQSGRHPKSQMTWDWFQVGTQLQSKAQEYGIKVEIVKRHHKVLPVRNVHGDDLRACG